jgi:3-oxoacyl-[acyl-carrier protein] reductase
VALDAGNAASMRRMDLGIAGKAALVTASSKGLGYGTAAALAAEGCRVAINGRDPERLVSVAASLPGAIALPGDVTDPATPARLVAETVDRLGGIDILIANAPGPPRARALDLEDDALASALEANLLTSIRLVRAAVPSMRTAGWGRIVLLTSNAVRQPIPDLAASNTARAGLWGWAKTAAQDLIDDGITLNLLCPGLHDTDRVRELGHAERLGDPADFGRVAAFLCSTSAGFVSGTALQVDGAATLGLL